MKLQLVSRFMKWYPGTQPQNVWDMDLLTILHLLEQVVPKKGEETPLKFETQAEYLEYCKGLQ